MDNTHYGLSREDIGELVKLVYEGMTKRINKRVVTDIGGELNDDNLISAKTVASIINDINNKIDNIDGGETVVEKTIKVSEVKEEYSSEETVIGKWLGQPLFRRVFSGTIENDKQLTSTSNIDKLINQSGYYGNECNKLPYQLSDSNYCTLKKVDNNITMVATNNVSGEEYAFVAEYTKKVSGDRIVTYKNMSALGYTGETNEDLVIPELFVAEDGEVYTVTKIDTGIFNYADNLNSVTIPETVTEVANYAFQNCTNLKFVTIKEGTTEIGNYTFQNCENLIEVNLPNTLIDISKYTFQYCKSLESIVIPDGVTSIYSWAFQYCENLKEVTLPAGLTRIDSFAFQYCNNLTTINFKGTEEQWNAVTVGGMNNPIKNATINFNYVAE